MKTTIDYLTAVKELHGLTSDYQLAKALRVRSSAIANYRAGRSGMDAMTAVRVAELLNVPPLEVLAHVEIERARTPAARNFWMRYAASVALAVVSFAGAVTPPPASAGTLQNPNSANSAAQYTLCA